MNRKTLVLLGATVLIVISIVALSNRTASSNYTMAATADNVTGTAASGSATGPAVSESATGSAVSGSATDPTPLPTATPTLRQQHRNTPATTIIDITDRTKKELKTMFYVKKIDDTTWETMQGVSYHDGCPVPRKGLRRVRILYLGFDEETHIGELITNKKIATTCRDIFQKLYFKEYQIEKVQPIDAYGASDRKSMKANNTSCFNHRVVAGTAHLSKHAYGLALDINPRYNPYVVRHGSYLYVSPKNGREYADRTRDFPHKIDHHDRCFKLFHKAGFFWGGDWHYTKDYQHFQLS